jgi:hypothetical protein
MSEVPDPLFDQGFEDTESVESDIDQLYQRFIAPIEQIRSIAEAPKQLPQSSKNTPAAISNLKVDPVNFLESRAHAFYRLLGLPVVGGSSFYNPGFDPNPKNQTNRNSVNSKVTQEDRTIMGKREEHFKLFNQLFAGQGYDTTLFCLCSLIPPPFNLLESNETPSANTARDSLLQALNTALPNLAESFSAGQAAFAQKLGYPLNSTRHILKPFTIDPAISHTVMPSDNQICVPFLRDLQATKISASLDVYLPRPGLEFIIRARLKDGSPDKTFLANLETVLTQVKDGSIDDADVLDAQNLRDVLLAFAGSANISDVNIDEIFTGFSVTQSVIVKQLIKQLKRVVELLHDSVNGIRKVEREISFLPIPAASGGIEKGGKNRDAVRTSLEGQLVGLKIRKLNADRDAEIDQSLGSFATSQYINMEKINQFQEEIENLTQRKNQLVAEGLKHMKTIELITGEASGLGLVDILAIYTALWTIKMEDLLGLLDQESFERLYNFNGTLHSSDVEARNSGSPPAIASVLENLETIIGSILTFADKLYLDFMVSPSNKEGGTPV